MKYKDTLSTISAIVTGIIILLNLTYVFSKGKFIGISLGILGTLLGILIAFQFIKWYLTRKKILRVFVAYGKSDEVLATRLIKDLENSGIEIITEENNVLVGEDVENKVIRLLSNVDAVIPLLRKDYYKNKVLKDVVKFSKTKAVKMLPIAQENLSLPSHINSVQNIDMDSDYERIFEKLMIALTEKSIIDKLSS